MIHGYRSSGGFLLQVFAAGGVAACLAAAARGNEELRGHSESSSASLRASQALQRDTHLSADTSATEGAAQHHGGIMLLQVTALREREKVSSAPALVQSHFGGLNPPSNLTANLMEGTWHRWSPPPTLRRRGFEEFFFSAALFDWCVFSVFIGVVLAFRVMLLLSSPSHPFYGFLSSVFLAAAYFVAVWTQLGHQSGKDWLAGYVMELTFMVENIFIFSLVINSLNVRPSFIPKALLFVVVGQILFELVFFMGLAFWLRQLPMLPYLLGVWLVCCGASCFCEGQQHDGETDSEPFATRMVKKVCGDRGAQQQIKSDGAAGSASDDRKDLLFASLVVGVLLLADFFLEIDVVLMKIETFSNGYIAFTSSAMAAIALPEMYFVGEALLHQFHLLKKGIASVLIIFGLQLVLCTSINYTVPPLAGCAFIVCVLASSIVLSAVHTRCSGGEAEATHLQEDPGRSEKLVGSQSQARAEPQPASL